MEPGIECTQAEAEEALTAACSADYTQVKHAELMIGQLELRPKFHPLLAEMAISNTLPVNIKRMAAICLKNGIGKFWRPSAPNSLSKEDKESVKHILLFSFTVPNKEVFDQILEAIAKISRYDFPKLWPEFMSRMVQVVGEDPDESEKLRALIMMYKVMKMLSTKRLSGDKKAFRETTEQVFTIIGGIWEKYLTLYSTHPANSLYLKTCLICLKLIRSMLSYGFEDISTPLPNSCLAMMLNQATSQLQHRITVTDPDLKDVYDKYLIVFIKAFMNIQERFPETFGAYLSPALEFAYKIGFEFADLLEIRLVARSLHLLSGIMLCETYDVFKLNNRGKDVSQNAITLNEYRNAFFTEARLQEMCLTCISKYLKLSELELQNWQESPEEFAYEETRHVSLFNLKAASEHFMLNMTATYQEIVCQYIVNLIKECAKHDVNSLEAVLLVDSIYSVTVICSYDLFDYVDIDKWFGTLIEELRVESQYSVVLRRRIIEIVGRWVTIKLSQDKHPAVYELCIEYMAPSHDLVVRLTSASALKAAVSDFAFYPAAFSSYLGPAMERLYVLLKEVEECESMVKILEVIISIIDGCGKHIVPFVDPLIQWLPELWQAATDHKMLQTQLLETARKLAKCLGPHSVKLYTFTNPVLHYAITQDPELILLEEGLNLWLTLLENAPAMTPHFTQMLACLSELLQLGSDSLKTSLLIIECTILLNPTAVISAYGDGIMSACCKLYQDTTGEGKVLVDNIVLTIIKTVPKQQWPNLSGTLQLILTSLHEFSDFTKVLTMNLNVICYIILLDMEYFNNIVASFNSPQLLKNLIEIWLSKADSFFRTEQYKLSLIALLTFLPHHSVLLESFFVDVINLVENSVKKCTDTDETSGRRYDCVVSKAARNADDHSLLSGETEDYKRRHILQQADLISKIDILTFVNSKMLQLQNMIGQQKFEKLSAEVDKKVTERLASYLC